MKIFWRFLSDSVNLLRWDSHSSNSVSKLRGSSGRSKARGHSGLSLSHKNSLAGCPFEFPLCKLTQDVGDTWLTWLMTEGLMASGRDSALGGPEPRLRGWRRTSDTFSSAWPGQYLAHVAKTLAGVGQKRHFSWQNLDDVSKAFGRLSPLGFDTW